MKLKKAGKKKPAVKSKKNEEKSIFAGKSREELLEMDKNDLTKEQLIEYIGIVHP
jgi:hypothetical protein